MPPLKSLSIELGEKPPDPEEVSDQYNNNNSNDSVYGGELQKWYITFWSTVFRISVSYSR